MGCGKAGYGYFILLEYEKVYNLYLQHCKTVIIDVLFIVINNCIWSDSQI